VKRTELIDGEKYKITSSPNHFDYYTGILKENIVDNDNYIQVFDRFIYHSVTGKTKGRYQNDVSVCLQRLQCYVFLPQKEKVQQDMEQRALDKILKRLINDDFTW